MKFSSASLACTKTTSASPRSAVLSAWPVPWATTLTTMPVLALNSGRMRPNKPESCVDVVEATRMDLSCARAGAAATSVIVAAKTTRLRRAGMMFSSSCECRDIGDEVKPAAHQRRIAAPPRFWARKRKRRPDRSVAAGTLCVKILERRALLLGLDSPTRVDIVQMQAEQQQPRHEKIREAIMRLTEQP